MKRYRKWVLLTIPAFLLITVPVLAFNSSAFLSPAQDYVNKACSKEKVSKLNAVLCYLFARSQEQDVVLGQHGLRLDDLEATTTTQSAQIADIQGSQIPDVEEIVFFPIGNLTHGQESPVVDINDHKIIFIDVKWEVGIGGFHVYYSEDQTNWNYQGDISGNSNDPTRQKTFPIKGKFYKIRIVSSFLGEATGFLY